MKPDSTVAVQVVKTGIAEGQSVQIVDGLTPGERIVTDGLDRLRDGARVSVVDPNQPANEAAPPSRGGARRGTRGTRSARTPNRVSGRQRRPGCTSSPYPIR